MTELEQELIDKGYWTKCSNTQERQTIYLTEKWSKMMKRLHKVHPNGAIDEDMITNYIKDLS